MNDFIFGGGAEDIFILEEEDFVLFFNMLAIGEDDVNESINHDFDGGLFGEEEPNDNEIAFFWILFDEIIEKFHHVFFEQPHGFDLLDDRHST